MSRIYCSKGTTCAAGLPPPLGAHFLDLRGLLFQLSRENVDRFRRPLQWCRSAAPASDGEHGQPWAAIAALITTQLCAVWSDSCELYDEISNLVA